MKNHPSTRVATLAATNTSVKARIASWKTIMAACDADDDLLNSYEPSGEPETEAGDGFNDADHRDIADFPEEYLQDDYMSKGKGAIVFTGQTIRFSELFPNTVFKSKR